MLETSNFVHGSAMRSLILMMGQGNVSNFYIVDLENFATASRRNTGDIHNSTVVDLFMTPIRQWKRLERVTVECSVHVFITHRPTLTLQHQLHNFDLFRTCHTSSFCTVAWQLARFQLTERIARSLGDSSCLLNCDSTKAIKYSTLRIADRKWRHGSCLHSSVVRMCIKNMSDIRH